MLKTYTRTAVLDIDLDRLCRVAARTGTDPSWEFLAAMQDFARNINEIEGLEL